MTQRFSQGGIEIKKNIVVVYRNTKFDIFLVDNRERKNNKEFLFHAFDDIESVYDILECIIVEKHKVPLHLSFNTRE